MKEFDEEINIVQNFIKRFLKGKLVVTAVMILLIVIFIWKNSAFITDINLTISNKKTINNDDNSTQIEEKKKNLDYNLDFGDIIIPPKPDSFPSTMVFEIKNSGNAILKNVNIGVNLGSEKVIKYDIVDGKSTPYTDKYRGKSIFNINVEEIQPKNSIYLHIVVESPIFKKIILNSDNLRITKELEYKNYILRKDDNNDANLDGLTKYVTYLFDILIGTILIGAILVVVVFTREAIRELRQKD